MNTTNVNAPSFFILYVEDAARSATFYADLMGLQPVESAPTFALFVLPSGVKLGLWTRKGVQPAATAPSGSMEVCFPLPGDAAVDRLHANWAARGLTIAQAPTHMDFGYTFVALDPDGHRLRGFAPGQD